MKKTVLAVALSLFTASALAADNTASDWRDVDPDNLVLIDTQYGQTVLELYPAFAPKAVERFKALTRAHFYDGQSFYRVIDGFVAQGGIGEGTAATGGATGNDDRNKAWPPLKAEFDRPIGPDVTFTKVDNADLFAPVIGHANGFPVGQDPKEGKEWIIHCPGTLAWARDNDPDTASTEFYIVIGQAPRRLDRNLTAFGRVLSGQQYLQKLNRGDPAVDSGVIADLSKRDAIKSVRMVSDIPEAARPHYQVMRTEGPAFAKWKNDRINPAPGFYVRQPAPVLDICLASVPTRLAPK
ncbi:MAG TPA: peptidylprolyl isomerase [Rhizomicrobium sp.]|jgi:peptidylprolyl isomerase|nr:peptidylprolyl isomerase [Rhizomicrobium sp.]